MKKTLAIALIVCMVACLAGCTEGVAPAQPQQDTPSSKYMTELEWLDTRSYMCAIEVDSFGGDVFAAGTYAATSIYTDNLEYGKEIPIVWDIYVSDTEYTNPRELQDSEYVLSVGGTDKAGGEVTVNAGQYLYIVYNETINTPAGGVQLKLK